MSGDDAAELPARVIESFGRRVTVTTTDGATLPAELFGKRLTCVCGDEVTIRPPSRTSGDVAKIVTVVPRRTTFARTDSRGRTEPLAANLSLLAVIVAPEPAPDPYITDRYLAGAALAGITGIVVVNKSDLPSAADAQFQALMREYETAGYEAIHLSARTAETVAPLKTRLAGTVAMFVGQSGMGKSTLTNALAPESLRPTRTISEATGEGRHTTVSTALFRIPGSGELIDSPGVRDYAPPPVEDSQVQFGWPEILALAPQCRFNNCMHKGEPGCAIRKAVEEGVIAESRYRSYLDMLNGMEEDGPYRLD